MRPAAQGATPGARARSWSELWFWETAVAVGRNGWSASSPENPAPTSVSPGGSTCAV